MATKKSLAIKLGPASLRRNVLLLALLFIGTAALRGAGDTRWPLYTKIVSTWGVRLPLVTLLVSLGFGLTGAWIAIGSDFLIQGLLAWWRFRKGAWKPLRI